MSKEYCNLYSYIKENNNKLLSVVEELCAEGLFIGRSKKTFLNPNIDLVNQLQEDVDKGQDEEALYKLKSLFLNDVFGTIGPNAIIINFNQKSMNAKELDLVPIKNLKWKKGLELAIFDLKNKEFPKEGEKKEKSKKAANDIMGGKELATRVEITNELINDYSSNEESKKFAYTLNSLLLFVKEKDKKVFEHVHKLLDPNLVVSWYIIVQPTAKMSNKHIPDSLFSKWANKKYKLPIKSVELIKELISSNNYDNKELKSIIEKRKSISGIGLKETIKDVVKSYNNNYHKLLDDELRFRFSDMKELEDDAIITLNLVDWDNPKKSLVLFDNIPKSNLLQSEIHKVITQFIKSNAFLYTPYNDEIIQKIKNSISGAGSSAKNTLYICGGSLRDEIKKSSCGGIEFSLEDFVGGLSAEQRDELKSYL
jgi:hypothetical protein